MCPGGREGIPHCLGALRQAGLHHLAPPGGQGAGSRAVQLLQRPVCGNAQLGAALAQLQRQVLLRLQAHLRHIHHVAVVEAAHRRLGPGERRILEPGLKGHSRGCQGWGAKRTRATGAAFRAAASLRRVAVAAASWAAGRQLGRREAGVVVPGGGDAGGRGRGGDLRLGWRDGARRSCRHTTRLRLSASH